MSLSLLSPAHRRLHEPQPYPVCPPIARHHRYTPGNLARLWWPEQSQRGSTAELQRRMDMGLQSPRGAHAHRPFSLRCQVAVTERLHNLLTKLQQATQ